MVKKTNIVKIIYLHLRGVFKSPADKHVFLYLLFLAKRNIFHCEVSAPSQVVAERLEISSRQVLRSLKSLQEAGLIEKTTKRGGRLVKDVGYVGVVSRYRITGKIWLLYRDVLVARGLPTETWAEMAAGSGLDMTEMDGSVVTSCRTGCDILAKKTVSMCHDGSPSLGHVAIAINNRGYSTPLRGRDARGGGESLVDFKFQDLKRAYQRFREDHTMNSSSWPSGGLARRTELAIESWLTTYPNPQHWFKRFEHYMAVFEGFSNAVSFHNVFEKCHEWDSRPGKMK